jgi:TonB family protein
MPTKYQLWLSFCISVAIHVVVLFLSFSLGDERKEEREYKALHVSLGEDGEIEFASESGFSRPLAFQSTEMKSKDKEPDSEGEGIKAPEKKQAQVPPVSFQPNSAPQPVNKAQDTRRGVNVGNSSSGVHNLSYEQLLPLWLERFKEGPKDTNGEPLRGRGVVFLTINRQGRILLYKIKRSTGVSELDRALIQMIKAANPAIPFPEEYRVGDKTVSYEIEFRF